MLWRDDDFAAAQSLPEWAAFDLSTPHTQEYPGWGAGLFVEPSLKIRPMAIGDLVLHYVDHKSMATNCDYSQRY